MSLYLKYRPENFNGVLGNTEQIKTLKNNILSKNPPRVYMIDGPRGVGKTTLARICASVLNTKSMNIHELDFAADGGVEAARELKEATRYSAMDGGNTVYICDEFHNATKNCQEAMLKTLEDTPENTYFFICTTEPNKVREAIRSRCIQIHLKSLQSSIIEKIIMKIAVKEGFEHISGQVLQDIAKSSKGAARDAIQLLEQISTLDNEEDMYAIINTGIAEDADVFELYKLLSSNAKWKDIAKCIEQFKDTKDAESIRYALINIASNNLLKNGKIRDAMLIDCLEDSLVDCGYPGLIVRCFQINKHV